MQGIHAKDDLLEAAGRHHPHQHAVGGQQVDPGGSHARRAFHGGWPSHPNALPLGLIPTLAETRGNRRRLQRHADLLRRALKVLDMPAKTGDQGTKRRHEVDLMQLATN